MQTKTIISKKHIMLSVLFAIYMSEYMISLIIMDQSAYGLSGAGSILHYLKMPGIAAGFLLFPLSRGHDADIRSGRMLMLVSNIVYIAGMAALTGIFFTVGLPLYIISCVVSLISLGFLGGAVYYYFAMGFVNHQYIGRLSGAGGAAAFLIQMASQYLIPAEAAMLILLFAGFAFTAYVTLFSRERFDWMFDEPLEYAKKGDPRLPVPAVIAAGTAAMLLLYMICGFTDTVIISMNFAGDMSMYAWPRLFGAAGYLVGGFLADLGHRRWLPLAALCMTLLCIPLPFMMREGYIITATCLYYIIVVAQIVFLNVFFWELAPKTSRPQLMAGMSRVLSCLSVVILPLFSYIPVMADIMIEVIFATASIICFVLGGYIPAIGSVAIVGTASNNNRLTDKDVLPDKDQAITEAVREGSFDPFDDFAYKHGLTPREKDFLVLLIESDDEVQIIASNMNISVRTAYRHIKSIYEKTGTETRYALMRYYYESGQGNPVLSSSRADSFCDNTAILP